MEQFLPLRQYLPLWGTVLKDFTMSTSLSQTSSWQITGCQKAYK